MASKAFAPANISCIFSIYWHKNPRWMGSYGIGFTLNEGVIAEASRAKKKGVKFYLNHKYMGIAEGKVVFADKKNKVITINILSFTIKYKINGISRNLNKVMKLGIV